MVSALTVTYIVIGRKHYISFDIIVVAISIMVNKFISLTISHSLPNAHPASEFRAFFIQSQLISS